MTSRTAEPLLAADQEMYEVRWHGRGGQGAVTSAKILADAGFRSGFAGVTSAPTFGAERRGAPITASTRLAVHPIRVLSQVNTPDVVVVLDESLIDVAGVATGLRPHGVVIVNSAASPNELAKRLGALPSGARVVAADVTGAATAAELMVAGVPMVNTAMLGAIAAATGLISMEALRAAIERVFAARPAAKNYAAATIAAGCVQV
ncbi:MAG: 2-oxoacid:acceptor oxidoreductase family protein [Thermoleophilia bacterium]